MEGYLTLLKKQVAANRRIHAFAKRQKDAIAAGEVGPVLESDLMRRQIIGQLQLLQPEMDAYLERLAGELQNLPDHLRKDILAVSRELEEIINQTVAIDRENEVKLKELREVLTGRINDIEKGKRALNGYRGSSRKGPRLFSRAG